MARLAFSRDGSEAIKSRAEPAVAEPRQHYGPGPSSGYPAIPHNLKWLLRIFCSLQLLGLPDLLHRRLLNRIKSAHAYIFRQILLIRATHTRQRRGAGTSCSCLFMRCSNCSRYERFPRNTAEGAGVRDHRRPRGQLEPHSTAPVSAGSTTKRSILPLHPLPLQQTQWICRAMPAHDDILSCSPTLYNPSEQWDNVHPVPLACALCDACAPRAIPFPAPPHASTALWPPLHVKIPLGETFILRTGPHTESDKLLTMDEPALRAPGSGSTSATELGITFGATNDADSDESWGIFCAVSVVLRAGYEIKKYCIKIYEWEQDTDPQLQQEQEQVRPVGLARIAESYKRERLFEFARWWVSKFRCGPRAESKQHDSGKRDELPMCCLRRRGIIVQTIFQGLLYSLTMVWKSHFRKGSFDVAAPTVKNTKKSRSISSIDASAGLMRKLRHIPIALIQSSVGLSRCGARTGNARA
ncbi:hypothetical protein B0H13DRAFT_1884881 [Mycena leptocephala]|nr:hypothetical protein B0H13DRAFT_1884881 [Mycena leptocephala]